MDSFRNKGTSTDPPTRLVTPLDPFIPKPLARIGNSKKAEKMTMSVLNHKEKSSGIATVEENTDADAYSLTRPSITHKPFQNAYDKEPQSDPNVNYQPSYDYHNEHNRPINREAALVRAMTSAGITHTLTKNCSTGDFTNCVCDR